MTEFDIVDAAAIRDGRATDAYFERTDRGRLGTRGTKPPRRRRGHR